MDAKALAFKVETVRHTFFADRTTSEIDYVGYITALRALLRTDHAA